MHPNFKTVALKKEDKASLEEIAKILGKSQSQVLSDYIQAISGWLAPYRKASLFFDDSDARVTSFSNEIIIKILGKIPSPNFTHGIEKGYAEKMGESKEVLEVVYEKPQKKVNAE